ncbi:hypothetical protein [Hymenobacter chitinivorans]|uniref:Uncharacterized protein n=1 Tax=Hymenobacter chitinivorans DSM 11115 TaxID=1121954 RepID=A0A2M9B5K3_9BACT|nr:hypothetical protein [Hymenobacter chitinivorans]PJJ53219.1 hypothetical protein CLV45_3879 [Hymenobacter chitinivorans DSM 11115]
MARSFTLSLKTLLRTGALLLSGLFSQTAHAQHDVILRADGQEIKAKILTVSPENIRYVRSDTVSTDTLQIATAQVFLLRYANGVRELVHPPAVSNSTEIPRAEAIRLGAADARKYFRAPGAFWGTYGATLANPMAGVVTGVAVGSTRPPAHNLIVSDPNLLQNPDYVRSYRNQAQNKKLGKAAAGFGVGMATWAVAVVYLLSITTHW